MNLTKGLGILATTAAAAAGCSAHGSVTYPTTTTKPSATAANQTDQNTAQSVGTDDYVMPSQPPVAEAARVAAQFANAWVDTTGGPTAWRERLRPLCETGLNDALQSAAPDRLTIHRIAGAPAVTTVDGATWLQATIPTDNGTLLLTLAAVDGGWLVSDIDLRRSAP